MNNIKKNSRQLTFISLAIAASIPMASSVFASESSDNTSKAFVDFRLRYENVDQDNSLKDADALTLRTLLHYQTKSLNGFSGVVEFEDSREVFGVEDYNDTLGHNTEYSVIADPNVTELDQGFVQYKQKGFTGKVGRQVITFDGHRFVGHVGWRQDKQTFDAISFNYQQDNLSASYAYITKRNRIFGEDKDLDAKDHLLNLSFNSDLGKLTAYSYILEVDEGVDNSRDTYGVSFDGKSKLADLPVVYRAEFASQEMETDSHDYDTKYINVEAGTTFEGVNVKLGWESLGSDGGDYGFSTPLATLHKFNGWSDQFLVTPKQGLEDAYVSISTKVLGGKFLVAYHDFSADKETDVVDDLGDEINVSYSRKIYQNFSGGVKYASYREGDSSAGKVDTDKLWVWIGARF